MRAPNAMLPIATMAMGSIQKRWRREKFLDIFNAPELDFHDAESLSASGSIERVRQVHLNETATRPPFRYRSA